MKNPLLIILILLLSTSFHSAGQPKSKMDRTTGSKVTFQDAQAIIAYHNKIRKELGEPPLSWDKKLAKKAQSWADYLSSNGCEIQHSESTDEKGEALGENLFWGSSSGYSILDAPKSWYDEKKDYKYKKIGDDFANAGHYTQMVWKATKEIGVGIAHCPNGETIIVANYYPAGNMYGEYPY